MIDIEETLHGYDYRILKQGKNSVSVLCRKENYASIEQALKTQKYHKSIHPFSRYHGYIYSYQLTDFLLYTKEEYEVEIVFELYCMSLTPKVVLPLDKLIQVEAWNAPRIEKKCYFINPYVEIIYDITDCIFNKRSFSNDDRNYIHNNKEYLLEEKTKEMLKKVFFRFTDILLELIWEEKYDVIYPKYITFTDY